MALVEARSGTAIISLIFTGCIAAEPAELPHVEGARSAFVILSGAGETRATSFALDEAPLRYVFDTVTATSARIVFLRERLDALPSPAGTIPSPSTPSTRGLPTPLRAFALDLSSSAPRPHALVDITESVVDDPEFQSVRLDISATACLEKLGCYSATKQGRCMVPCPSADAPACPERPTLPSFECGRWPRVKLSALGTPCVAAPPATDGCNEPTVRLCDLEVCKPERSSCLENQLFTPGLGCVNLGAECTDWPQISNSRAVYVRPGATGGDGSSAHPWGSIAEALLDVAHSNGETVIALAPVSFRETLSLEQDAQLVGCRETKLDGAITVRQGTLRVENVRIGPGASLRVEANAGFVASHLLVDRIAATTPWLWLAGTASVALSKVKKSRVGIKVEGGRLGLDSSQIDDATSAALRLEQGGRATIEDVFFGAVDSAAIATTSGPFIVAKSSAASVDGSFVENSTIAVQLSDHASASISQSMITTRSSNAQAAFEIGADASLKADHILVLARPGIKAKAHARFAFDNVVGQKSNAEAGPWIAMGGSSEGTVNRLAMSRIRTSVSAHDDARLTLRDLWQEEDEANSGPPCLRLENQASIDLARARLTRCQDTAIAIRRPIDPPMKRIRVSAALTDVEVVAPRQRGIAVVLPLRQSSFDDGPYRATLARVRIRTAQRGLDVGGTTGDLWGLAVDVTGTDVVIRGTTSRADCGIYSCGDGVSVRTASRLSLERFLIAEAQAAGILIEAGGKIVATKGIIEDSKVGVFDFNAMTYDVTAFDQVLFRNNETIFEKP